MRYRDDGGTSALTSNALVTSFLERLRAGAGAARLGCLVLLLAAALVTFFGRRHVEVPLKRLSFCPTTTLS